MKYIVTESQYKMLFEQNMPLWFKRRYNAQSLREIIDRSIEYAGSPCDYEDEFEYADNVISYAVNEFLTINEDIFEDPRYDEFQEYFMDECRNEYGEELFNIYRSQCEEDNYEQEY